MSERTFTRDIWFCKFCGFTFDRSDKDPTFACGHCTNGRMTPATLQWVEGFPDPDPLAVLLVDVLEGTE